MKRHVRHAALTAALTAGLAFASASAHASVNYASYLKCRHTQLTPFNEVDMQPVMDLRTQ